MVRKRVKLIEFEVPIPKGRKRITDMDETADYLFIHAPEDIYTVYFDIEFPSDDGEVLTLPDRLWLTRKRYIEGQSAASSHSWKSSRRSNVN